MNCLKRLLVRILDVGVASSREQYKQLNQKGGSAMDNESLNEYRELKDGDADYVSQLIKRRATLDSCGFRADLDRFQ